MSTGRKIGTFLIILVLILAVSALGYMIYSIMGSDSDSDDSGNNVEQVAIKPEIVLEKSDVEDNKVKIYVHATTEDEAGLVEIILPDERTIAINDKSYEDEYVAEENGDYVFTLVAANGEKIVEKTKVTDIPEASANKPYVPKGFHVLDGSDVKTGYVIEDDSGNQYVWVPVENGKISRTTLFDTKYEESNSTASALVNSVAKNYGFYIARFEASEVEIDGKRVATSLPGRLPWTNINCTDAIKYANSSAGDFGYEDCQTALINSYAWDATLSWIDSSGYDNYSSNVDYGNYGGSIQASGTTERDMVNCICDLAGNVSEWTTEICKQSDSSDSDTNVVSKVIRGGSANLSRTPASRIGYAENLSEQFWGFRLVLYK